MGLYIAACTRKDVKWVASIEKADVLAYLRGQTDSAAQVRFGVVLSSVWSGVVLLVVLLFFCLGLIVVMPLLGVVLD